MKILRSKTRDGAKSGEGFRPKKNQVSGAAGDKAPPTDRCGAYYGRRWAGEERAEKLKAFLL